MSKILIVDDDPKIVRIFEKFLKENGFEVETAIGGKEGMELLSSGKKFDLLLLDLGMPQVNGSDVLMGMVKLKLQIPTLIITGSLDIKKYSHAIETRNILDENILFKPINLKVLLDKVNKLLESSAGTNT